MSAQIINLADQRRARHAARRAAEPADGFWSGSGLMFNPFALAWLEGFLGVRTSKPTTIILTEDPA